jgi:hypothetical protein
LRIMICVRSDESADLIRSYLIRSLGVESIILNISLSEAEKKVGVKNCHADFYHKNIFGQCLKSLF